MTDLAFQSTTVLVPVDCCKENPLSLWNMSSPVLPLALVSPGTLTKHHGLGDSGHRNESPHSEARSPRSTCLQREFLGGLAPWRVDGPVLRVSSRGHPRVCLCSHRLFLSEDGQTPQSRTQRTPQLKNSAVRMLRTGREGGGRIKRFLVNKYSNLKLGFDIESHTLKVLTKYFKALPQIFL